MIKGRPGWESIYLETPAGFTVRQDALQLCDVGDPSVELMRSEESEQLESALRRLEKRDRNILRRRYGLDTRRESLARIAKAFGVTKPCIAKREKLALKKARSVIENNERKKRHERRKFNN